MQHVPNACTVPRQVAPGARPVVAESLDDALDADAVACELEHATDDLRLVQNDAPGLGGLVEAERVGLVPCARTSGGDFTEPTGQRPVLDFLPFPSREHQRERTHQLAGLRGRVCH